ncbi:DUF6497 family protein [Pseudooceanicola sp.]|uniref:DUF6497 family protein n=1 Tax=Pseudooceanicola sp. TaxID=1914328 RepID=UPI0035C71EB3
MRGQWTKVAALGAFCAAATTVWGQEEPLAVPSGIAMTLLEVLEETQPDGSVWLRFRYVAPGITRDQYDRIQDDFAALCESEAVTYRTVTRAPASQAVISIAAAPVEFGTTAPEIPQFFEAFRLEDGACIWEGF